MESPVELCGDVAADEEGEELDRAAGDLEVLRAEGVEAEGSHDY